jgi:hypothetical protein
MSTVHEPEAEPIYGMVAEFETPEALVAAIRLAREEGYRNLDAYTPFPIEGLDEELHFRPTRLPWVVFAAGCLGTAVAFFTQYFASVLHYPLNVGGRPLNSWPAFVPVMFELTVLSAAILGVIAMLGRNGLPRLHHPLFNVPEFSRATTDRFFLCIEAVDPKFDRGATGDFLTGLAPLSVAEVPQ